MSAWCHSLDAQAAKDEIKTEIVRQGWHLLSITSSKGDMGIARDQKRKFVSYLALTYPNAAKDAPSWLQFIKTTMGVLKEWNSVSAESTQTRPLKQVYLKPVEQTLYRDAVPIKRNSHSVRLHRSTRSARRN